MVFPGYENAREKLEKSWHISKTGGVRALGEDTRKGLPVPKHPNRRMSYLPKILLNAIDAWGYIFQGPKASVISNVKIQPGSTFPGGSLAD